MQLSTNFYLREFTKYPRIEIPPIKIFLLEALCQGILQPIRDFLRCPIKVTNGIRFDGDYERLIKAGYHPSETSDHGFQDCVSLTSHKKIARFGKEYAYSVGAADIVPACGAEVAFARMREFFEPITCELKLPAQNIEVGQMILEHGKSYWLHVSNPATVIYDGLFVQRYLKKTPFLISLDNGKTYQPVA